MPTKACKRVDVFDPKDNSWTKLKDLPSAITHINMVLDGRCHRRQALSRGRFPKWRHASAGDVGAACALISGKAIYEKEEQQNKLPTKNYKT